MLAFPFIYFGLPFILLKVDSFEIKVDPELTKIVNTYAAIFFPKENVCPILFYYPQPFGKLCHYKPFVRMAVMEPINVLTTDPKMSGDSIDTTSSINVLVHNTPQIIYLEELSYKNVRKRNQSIYIQTAIFAGSSLWITTRVYSLVHFLAKKGFDVWLGDVRGSFDVYPEEVSNKMSLDGDLNMDDLTQFILPSVLNHIENIIQDRREKIPNYSKKIIFIGYSLGATYGLMLAAGQPEVANNLLRGMIFVAPLGNFENSPIKPILENALVYEADETSGFNTLFHSIFEEYHCGRELFYCLQILENFFGKFKNPRVEDLLSILGDTTGPFLKNMAKHLTQIAQSDQLQKYDHGKIKNMEFYGQATPPPYNLSDVTIPVITLYGKTDNIATETGIRKLMNSISSTKRSMEALNNGGNYNHLDFFFDREGLTNTRILEIIIFDLNYPE